MPSSSAPASTYPFERRHRKQARHETRDDPERDLRLRLSDASVVVLTSPPGSATVLRRAVGESGKAEVNISRAVYSFLSLLTKKLSLQVRARQLFLEVPCETQQTADLQQITSLAIRLFLRAKIRLQQLLLCYPRLVQVETQRLA